jgi:endonuclease/exonuclease/phosphatase (EEP) superfamily protein YafD
MGGSDPRRWPPFVPTSLYLLAWFAFVIALVSLLVRYAPIDNHFILVTAAISPYLNWAAAVAAVLLVIAGQRWLAAAALLLLLVGIAVRSPVLLADSQPTGSTVPLRILTANLHNGTADPKAVAVADHEHADILVVQELPPSLADSLGQEGLASEFPYTVLLPRPHAAGVGIWSRFPIVQTSTITRYQLGAVTATVRMPGAASDVVIATIHLAGPWPQPLDRWRSEIDRLPETLRQLVGAAGPGAVIVAGDFNATEDFRPFRRLLDAGFKDARGRAVSGMDRTYPADSVVPPIIGIDHILTYNSWARDTHTVLIAGSDHRGLGATIHIPA